LISGSGSAGWPGLRNFCRQHWRQHRDILSALSVQTRASRHAYIEARPCEKLPHVAFNAPFSGPRWLTVWALADPVLFLAAIFVPFKASPVRIPPQSQPEPLFFPCTNRLKSAIFRAPKPEQNVRLLTVIAKPPFCSPDDA